jgi:hypothetical protein
MKYIFNKEVKNLKISKYDDFIDIVINDKNHYRLSYNYEKFKTKFIKYLPKMINLYKLEYYGELDYSFLNLSSNVKLLYLSNNIGLNKVEVYHLSIENIDFDYFLESSYENLQSLAITNFLVYDDYKFRQFIINIKKSRIRFLKLENIISSKNTYTVNIIEEFIINNFGFKSSSNLFERVL